MKLYPPGGGGPYTIQWSNGATTAFISGLAASYYSVDVIDNNGEKVTGGLNLTEPEMLKVECATTHVSCYRCFNGSIQLNVTGGVFPYAYAWSDGPTWQNRTGLGGGVYVFTITDANGCRYSKEVTLTEPPRDNWSMTGNAGSSPVLQFIGTNDSTDFVFRTNNAERLRIKSNGVLSSPALSGNGVGFLMLDANGNFLKQNPATRPLQVSHGCLTEIT